MAPPFLELPLEIRLAVYETYLADHRVVARAQQPDNTHLRLLRVCKQMAAECEVVGFKQYASLSHEDQILSFLKCSDSRLHSRITWLDAANDARVVGSSSAQYHVSWLHRCITELANLQTLRVFDCHRAVALHRRSGLAHILGSRVQWAFERALFEPGPPPPQLSAYQLFITSLQPASIFQLAETEAVQFLRLSGNVSLCTTDLPTLRHLSLVEVTSTFFERKVEGVFRRSPLESFVYDYGQSRAPAFEMHDDFLKEVIQPHGVTLRQIVLLNCNKVTTAALRDCLADLPRLKYFALSFVTTRELDSAFIRVLPPSLEVFKIAIRTGKFQIPLEAEESSLCDAVKVNLLVRVPPPRSISIDLRDAVVGERISSWFATARQRRVHLHFGPWKVISDELGRPCD
ncbi:uncharacterized protein SCHCODRAFT_02490504 [Schizophyllum commune H4-8]|nr:uncharacterized protein SCHCODRAFT_02490504 [Schizophyllum commune H4-8]KAI5898129.1 hypothetical protein SCHCODRAFT_02490504 [Schizophyllum commune H4-8]